MDTFQRLHTKGGPQPVEVVALSANARIEVYPPRSIKGHEVAIHFITGSSQSGLPVIATGSSRSEAFKKLAADPALFGWAHEVLSRM